MVKTPLYPKYSAVTSLIKILQGVPVDQFKSMSNAVYNLRGTPQNTADWTSPDIWIAERLSGSDKKMAVKIWHESEMKINPRWTLGEQLLMNSYELIEEKNGTYQLSARGKIFIKDLDNEVCREIDEQEGLLQILFQASVLTKGKRSDFLGEWKAYLSSHSNVRKDNTINDYLRLRLANLADRQFLNRDGNSYTISGKGLEYLDSVNKNSKNTTATQLTFISREVEKFNKQQRENMRSFLETQISPIQFEKLISDLLVAMGYDDVLVTAPTNDKGVDVTAVSQQGITTVKEVIQVKKQSGNVQRPVLDSLRGSLHRFDAFQGTIITLSDFAKGAKDAAYEKGAAPITLINGEKLIDMLIENELIISKKKIEYLTIDETYFNLKKEDEIE
jgi:restriction system protein